MARLPLAVASMLLVLLLVATGCMWGEACKDRSTVEGEAKDGSPSSSWTEWAKEKISEGLGVKEEPNTDRIFDGSGKAAEVVKDKVTDTSNEAYRKAQDVAAKIKNDASDVTYGILYVDSCYIYTYSSSLISVAYKISGFFFV